MMYSCDKTKGLEWMEPAQEGSPMFHGNSAKQIVLPKATRTQMMPSRVPDVRHGLIEFGTFPSGFQFYFCSIFP